MHTQSVGESRASDLATETCIRIRAIAPAGLAAWLPQLPAIHAADDRATSALLALGEHPGGQGLGARLAAAQDACNALVSEWQRAASGWERKGRPVAGS